MSERRAPAEWRLQELQAFRAEGERALKWAADYLANSERYPALSQIAPGDIAAQLPKSPPQEGVGVTGTVEEIDRVIMPGVTHWNSPEFMAYFAVTSSPPGILGELFTAVLNQNALVWQASPAITELEPVVLDWLRQMLGFPEGLFGITYDTASISTLCAVAAARQAAVPDIGERGFVSLPQLRMYASEEAHSVVDKAAMILGIGRQNLVKIPVDSSFRMVPEELERAIRKDSAAGMKPFCVVATVGTTSTTSVDPVRPIAEICKRHGIWLHVDAAYGGSAAILPEMRWIFDGIEHADSICMNPHKWLLVPVDLSAFYTRRPEELRKAFTYIRPYLETDHDDSVINLTDYGPQLGRRFRGLKLWLVIRAYGVSGLQAILRRHISLAQNFESWVQTSEALELTAKRNFATVCFRARPSGIREQDVDDFNRRLLAKINASGDAFLSHTIAAGVYMLRVSIGNMWTDSYHIERLQEVILASIQDLQHT